MLSRRAALLAPALVAAVVLAACSSNDEPKADPEASEGSGAKIVEVSPLTGEAMKDGRPDNPVFVVKIENTANGAPQYGLNKADLVVEQLVEGGLTRLAALYYSTLPSKVGHVRSMRGTDVGIAAPVAGQIVASGGAGGTYTKVKKAGLKVHSEDHGAPGFSSDPAKFRPYNRMLDLAQLSRKAKGADIPGPYVDWTAPEGDDAGDGEDEKGAGADASAQAEPKAATKASVRFSRSSTTQWALKDGRWSRTNGHAEKEFKADSLVVMFADVGDAGYTDPGGNPVPETVMKGTGRAVILTKDGALETEWAKKKNDSTISFATKDGTPVTVDPGKIWIELVPKNDGAVDLG